MKQKILDTIYKKLSEAYKIQFIPFDDFEQQLSEKHDEFVDAIVSYFQGYFSLMNSKNIEESSQIIKKTMDDFILESLNSSEMYKYNYHVKEDLEELKNSSSMYNIFEKRYKDNISIPNNSFKVQLAEFISKRLLAKYPKIDWHDFNEDLILENIFYRYLFSLTRDYHFNVSEKYLSIEESDSFKNRAEEIIEKFREKYLLNEHLWLHKLAKKYLDDVDFTGLETFIVNVGSRSTRKEHSGWNTNNFNVINNGLDFGFSSSSIDAKPIKGHFIHIFILHQKHLEKISITVMEQEQTKFIISRDFEKLSIKNECEVLISKHHGNETIIFESRKEAINFQNKILELKEYRGPNR
jgi:hypothetical protein